MTRVPTIQEDFLKLYNPFYNLEFPSDFYEKQDLFKTIVGEYCFRGEDYNGNGYSFSDTVLMSILANERKNLCRMKTLYMKLKFLMPECTEKGFCELSQNISEMLKSFDSAFFSFGYQNFEDYLKETLKAMRINIYGIQGNDDLPF